MIFLLIRRNYSVLPDKVREAALFEISEIDNEILQYQPLFNLIRIKNPDLIETTAVASVLHSLYNGIEKIFVMIAKGLNEEIVDNKSWHKDLLLSMSEQNEQRKAVITKDNYIKLANYLAFRHFYRHSYSKKLEWSLLKEIALNIETVWQSVKKDITDFINSKF